MGFLGFFGKVYDIFSSDLPLTKCTKNTNLSPCTTKIKILNIRSVFTFNLFDLYFNFFTSLVILSIHSFHHKVKSFVHQKQPSKISNAKIILVPHRWVNNIYVKSFVKKYRHVNQFCRLGSFASLLSLIFKVFYSS